MDIFSWLRRDHAEILGMLGEARHGRAEESSGEEAWMRVAGRWEIHARIEENFLFPLLKGDSGLRHTLARVVQAHERIRECLRTHSPPEKTTEAWASAEGLMDTLDRLQDIKERRIFPRARESLSPDEAEELASEVLDFLHGLEIALAAGR